MDDVQLVPDQEISNCQVTIDIKFCSDPNAFNCRKKGVLPVTIFGTEFFDVSLIDFETIELCLDDDNCTMEPLVGWSFMDRGQPGDTGVAECAWSECPADTEPDHDPNCVVEEMDYLNPDFYDDVDVAFSAMDVQD